MANMWSKKYAPTSIKELIAPGQVKSYLLAMEKSGELDNFTLASTMPGVGKTTAAKVVAACLGHDVHTINGSMDRGISVIENKVEPLAKSVSMDGKARCIIIDEADNMTRDAQLALREVINVTSVRTRFIFTCNYRDKIIEPLLSRLPVISYTYDSKEDKVGAIKATIKMLHGIYMEEVGEKPDVDKLKDIVVKNFPDIRKCFHLAQAMARGGEVSQAPIEDIVAGLVEAVASNNYYAANQIIEENDLGSRADEVISNFTNSIEGDILWPVTINAAKYIDMLTRSTDKTITLKAFVFNVMEDTNG